MTAHPPASGLPLVLVAATAVLAVAGCGATPAETPAPPVATSPAATSSTSTGTGASAPTTAAGSTPSVAQGPPPTPSTSAGGGSGTGSVCAAAGLTIRYADDRGGAGAGNVTGTLTFTNTTSARCTLTGFPGVSYVGGGNGTQVGVPATRTDAAVRTKTLAPGASVRASLRRTQPGAYGAACRSTKVDGFRVYPPGSTASAFVAFETVGCRSTAAPLLQVGPVD